MKRAIELLQHVTNGFFVSLFDRRGTSRSYGVADAFSDNELIEKHVPFLSLSCEFSHAKINLFNCSMRPSRDSGLHDAIRACEETPEDVV
jgi:hypothetical protein